MQQPGLKVVVAIDRLDIRSMVLRILEEEGCDYSICNSSFDLKNQNHLESLVFLETNDDIARLTQTVYEMYAKSNATGTMDIIGIASDRQMSLNPYSTLWCIDDHAAMICLANTDDPELESGIRSIIKRWGQPA